MMKKLYTSIVLLLIATVMLAMAVTKPVHAYTDEADIAECQRLDILNGCNCKCSDPNLNQVCKVVGGVGACFNESPPLAKDSTTTTIGIRPFPTVGNSGGVLIVDSAGNVQVGATGANIFKWLFWILGTLALFLGMYGIYTYSTAGADDDAVQRARSILKNALIGFFIAVGGLLIVLIVSNIAGFREDPANIDAKVANSKSAAEKIAERQEEKNIFDRLFK